MTENHSATNKGPFRAVVSSNKKIGGRFYRLSLEFEAAGAEAFAKAVPGQFAELDLSNTALPAAEAVPEDLVDAARRQILLRRPFSFTGVTAKEKKTSVDILYRVVGPATLRMTTLSSGNTVSVIGPLGNGFTIHSDLEHMLLMAGGMGIAPIVFLANVALERSKKVTLLRGVRYSVQLLPDELLPRGVTIITATEDGERGHKGRASELIPDYIESASQIFACGPMPMYRDMANKYHSFIKDKSVQVSLEVRMGCGLGVCYGCTVKTRSGLRQVCKDGPIFNLEDILWDEWNYFY